MVLVILRILRTALRRLTIARAFAMSAASPESGREIRLSLKTLLPLLPVPREKVGMRVLLRRRLLGIRNRALTLPSPGVPGEGFQTKPTTIEGHSQIALNHRTHRRLRDHHSAHRHSRLDLAARAL